MPAKTGIYFQNGSSNISVGQPNPLKYFSRCPYQLGYYWTHSSD